MSEVELTNKDRSFAATAGISGTPFGTPPDTPSRRSSQPSESLSIPKPAYLIILVEGCERFCYYGLKTILLLYFINFLSLDKDSGTVGVHLFTALSYFTPILGAILSDGFVGRYWTILVLSIVYFIGTVVLSITAIPNIGHKQLAGPIVGLFLIAVGTGGIKSSVGAFGADQISKANTRQLSRYFALFYFAINTGSFISTVLTPILRSNVHCFGYDCYALAFGIPTILMLIALVLFVIGTPSYKRIPPKENIIAKFFAILFRAIKNAIFHRSSGSREHWLYHASDKYDIGDIEDVRAVLRVALLFVPIPVFFALYDQSGSRWTYQATLMNGNLGNVFTIQPDQMQALNSILILFFIPLFEEVIYPLCARCNFLVKPLQRMFAGMIVMVITFLVAAVVQSQIESKANAIPIRTTTNIFNGYQCPIVVDYHNRTIEFGDSARIPCSLLTKNGLSLTTLCKTGDKTHQLLVDSECPSVLIFSEVHDESLGTIPRLTSLTNQDKYRRGIKRYALLRMVSLDGRQTEVKLIPNQYTFKLGKSLTPTDYQSVLSTEYQVESIDTKQTSTDKFRVAITAIYTGVLYHTKDNQLHVKLFEDAPSFTVHILWQIFQYILLTIAEIFVSITGLVFAYAQAPKRYKTVIMSLWFLTTAIGNLIVVFVAQVRLVPNQALEFILFAGFMAFATFIFGILAIRYKDYIPTDHDTEDQQLILNKQPEEILQ